MDQHVLTQLGAPVLLDYTRLGSNSRDVESSRWRYPRLDPDTIHETLQRRKRVCVRWNYSVDLQKIQKVPVQHKMAYVEKKRRKQKQSQPMAQIVDTIDEPICLEASLRSEALQRDRFALMLQHNSQHCEKDLGILGGYTEFDRGYIPAPINLNPIRGWKPQPKLEWKTSSLTREYQLRRNLSSDPSYLAPFGMDALRACKPSHDLRRNAFDKSMTASSTPRPKQGNCLLCCPCPCPQCKASDSNMKSWLLLHPTGHGMDNLCASNLIPPMGKENAGHMFTVGKWEAFVKKKAKVQSMRLQFPNEICLDDTILEVKQSGDWTGANPSCVFVVRTSTHVSVLNVTTIKATLQGDDSDYGDDVCWGNYVLEERLRLDNRSFSKSVRSYRPVAMACHPKFGNQLTSARFAIVSHGDNNNDRNVVHACRVGSEQATTMHAIPSLKYISHIDFSCNHPMCLWSAATTHVRPALSPGVQFKNQQSFGSGTSLFSIDLRSNSATFQWSPSATEMVTEGVHSISGLLTDWQRESTIWVCSRSARKTWEIDSRMPCRAVNTFSLTATCEDTDTTFQQVGPHGENSLIVKSNSEAGGYAVLGVDTTPSAFGFHVYQPPAQKARLQTDNIECLASTNPDCTEKSGVVKSAVFPLPEMAQDIYTCGIACLRLSTSTFVAPNELHLFPAASSDSAIVCTLTMTSRGDLYCHNLLQSSREPTNHSTFPGLPVGNRVLPVPSELDGRAKHLEQKRWKPSGGNNLKMFLTNHSPVPWNVVSDSCSPTRPSRTVAVPKVLEGTHPSLRGSGVGTTVDVGHNAGCATLASNNLTTTTGNALVLPTSLVEKKRPIINFSVDRSTGTYAATDFNDGKSDINAHVLKRSEALWDVWGDSDSD